MPIDQQSLNALRWAKPHQAALGVAAVIGASLMAVRHWQDSGRYIGRCFAFMGYENGWCHYLSEYGSWFLFGAVVGGGLVYVVRLLQIKK